METLAIACGFIALGMGWAAQQSDLAVPTARVTMPVDGVDRVGGAERSPSVYASVPMDVAEPTLWLVDGYNVLHAGVLGGRDRSQWWTGERRRELLERAENFERGGDAAVWVVFDGPSDPLERPPGSLRCVFAPSADDWLIEQVRRADDPTRIAVVTGDRQVAGRARHRGAKVVSPREFLARCAT